LKEKKRGLGKGLDAIFAENDVEAGPRSIELKLSELEPNRNQPRKDFDEEALADLADSISQHGILQPLLVRPLLEGGYQIVAGERRWRAARMAGVQTVPALVRDLSDEEVMQLALIENLQREDLNPLEEAQGYQSLMDSYGYTQESVAKSVGRSRPAVANALRLLSLPQEIQKLISDGSLSAGQGRALLAFPKELQISLAKRCLKEEITVRDLEKLAKSSTPKASLKKKNSYYEEVALSLHEQLGRRVKVSGTRGKGFLQIEFRNEEDLKNLLRMFEE
jgi:ParB family chromosome partitioning protein